MIKRQLLLSIQAVQDRIPYSKVHIYRLMHKGQFPQAVKIGERRVAWIECEVDDWIKERIAQRNNQSA